MPVCEREYTDESPAPADAGPQVSVEVQPLDPPAARPRRFPWGLGAVALLVCVAAGFIHLGARGEPIRVQALPFRFRAQQRQDYVLLTWNPNAPAVRGATKATLTVQDGKQTEDIEIGLDTLRFGGVRYYPIFQDVSFQLTLAESARRTVSEQARP